MFQEWAVSQLAFNYRTLTLMVTFLAYLSGLDTRASIEGKRRVGGRFHCYKKLKSLNNTPHYHHGEWLQASTWVITKAPRCRRPGLPAPTACSSRTMQPQHCCLREGLRALRWVFVRARHYITLLRDGAWRSHAVTGAEALFSAQLEAQPLPLSCTMFSFPSWKAAPHKTISLLTISVTPHTVLNTQR